MKRRKAREYALQFLYRIDFVNVSPENNKGTKRIPDIKNNLEIFWADTEEKDSDTKAFAEDIISGTIKNLKEIDPLIQKTAKKWNISRMASIDRNILRFAAYELLFRKDIPTAVTINEALEIAKKYSTLESAPFINGILDKIAKEHAKKMK
ncbi:MAG TPA: transcription antitermination factor NusB [Nitrospiraceae bacterium]|nr:MAG: transcription antitermination factor NusB [Nitrospirae bacterium GWA2_46_11]HAK87577.1 transcription antitermination factor NusB [Nitrospiraceae bacterium]HCZ12899.1 transcription antitermination factor NusB [Nitrospiraceae bacterium]